MVYSSRSEYRRNGSTEWKEEIVDDEPKPQNEGDLHIGFGYGLPLSNRLNLVVRGEYAVGIIFRNIRRNALSISTGVGWRFF
jgi:hypothetical protein